jgi:hypothetical protein
MGGPYTGAAMNPARASGRSSCKPSGATGGSTGSGPLLGAGIAALAYEHLYLRTLSLEPPGPPETGLEEPRPGDAASI